MVATLHEGEYIIALRSLRNLPILRDFICPKCGLGTSRAGGLCLDCVIAEGDADE